MAEAAQRILIIEDDLDVAEMLNAYFRIQGYDVVTANRGEDGIRSCTDFKPDIIIQDIRLPDINGYEVARRLRENRRTADIPIIFLTDKRDRSERLHGLELGADDYITKPFDVQELRLRIRNALQRAGQDSLTNPVTGLPDGRLVDERLGECLDKYNWTMLIISLENLDSFREAYGFVASDDVLRAVSLMVQNVRKEIGGSEDFLGHLSQMDFVLITTPDKAGTLKERIQNRLELSLDYFYPIKDREPASRQGQRLAFKIGVLQNGEHRFGSSEDVKMMLLKKMQ